MRDLKKVVEFTGEEIKLLKSLNSPAKIQDWLDKIDPNFEISGETALSPRRVMKEKKAHCLEAALFGATAFWYHGLPPLILDLVSSSRDVDHVVVLFKVKGNWGALGKTNHAVLRYREPVYKTPRELAMSFFHEYFTDDGIKTLRSFSVPIDLSKRRDVSWITEEKDIWYMIDYINAQPHHNILTASSIHRLRKAHPTEIKAGKIVEHRPPKK